MLNVTPWQPSVAAWSNDTTPSMTPAAPLVLAATGTLIAPESSTFTSDAGQLASSDDVIDPAVKPVNVTAYGLSLSSVKWMSPSVRARVEVGRTGRRVHVHDDRGASVCRTGSASVCGPRRVCDTTENHHCHANERDQDLLALAHEYPFGFTSPMDRTS